VPQLGVSVCLLPLDREEAAEAPNQEAKSSADAPAAPGENSKASESGTQSGLKSMMLDEKKAKV
jgi:hypothetical protein